MTPFAALAGAGVCWGGAVLIPGDDALRAAARLRERLPLVAAHRFDDAPRTRAERNAAHCRAWRAKVRAAARAHGMTVEQYRAMVRTNTKREGDAISE